MLLRWSSCHLQRLVVVALIAGILGCGFVAHCYAKPTIAAGQRRLVSSSLSYDKWATTRTEVRLGRGCLKNKKVKLQN